jgi:hypothetical protein
MPRFGNTADAPAEQSQRFGGVEDARVPDEIKSKAQASPPSAGGMVSQTLGRMKDNLIDAPVNLAVEEFKKITPVQVMGGPAGLLGPPAMRMAKGMYDYTGGALDRMDQAKGLRKIAPAMGAVPVFGPGLEQFAGDVQEGNWPEAIGDAASMLLPFKVPKIARAGAGAVERVAPIVKAKVKGAAQGAAEVGLHRYSTAGVAGAAAGQLLRALGVPGAGYEVGGLVGAAVPALRGAWRGARAAQPPAPPIPYRAPSGLTSQVPGTVSNIPKFEGQAAKGTVAGEAQPTMKPPRQQGKPVADSFDALPESVKQRLEETRASDAGKVATPSMPAPRPAGPMVAPRGPEYYGVTGKVPETPTTPATAIDTVTGQALKPTGSGEFRTPEMPAPIAPKMWRTGPSPEAAPAAPAAEAPPTPSAYLDKKTTGLQGPYRANQERIGNKIGKFLNENSGGMTPDDFETAVRLDPAEGELLWNRPEIEALSEQAHYVPSADTRAIALAEWRRLHNVSGIATKLKTEMEKGSLGKKRKGK